MLFALVFFHTGAFSQVPQDSVSAVYFQSGSFAINEAQAKRLDCILRQYPGTPILRLCGHSDSIGSQLYNMELSSRRSLAVFRWITDRHPDLSILEIKNYGEAAPASATHLDQNRRVDIFFQGLGLRRDSISTGPPKVWIQAEKLVLDQLYFKPDLASLESSSIQYLYTIIDRLKTFQGAKFNIRGHVNSPGTGRPGSGFQQKMQQLSENRAKLIFQYMVDHGIPASSISYEGLGNREPQFPNPKNEEEQRRNMRVEIVVFSPP